MGRRTGQVLRENDGRLGPRWSREQIIERMRAWTERYGEPPLYEEWHRGSPRFDPERFGPPGRGGRGEWPSTQVVVSTFGSWPEGLGAAGLPQRTLRIEDPPRTCPVCGEEFSRGERESRASFLDRKTCSATCGGQLGEVSRRAREREARFVEMRERGLTNIEIAEREGVARHVVASVLSRARRRGVSVPWSGGRA